MLNCQYVNLSRNPMQLKIVLALEDIIFGSELFMNSAEMFLSYSKENVRKDRYNRKGGGVN